MVALPASTPASPEVVWERLTRFLYGDTRAPFEPFPEVTTVEWVRDRVAAALSEQFFEDARAPGGLETFFRGWAFEGDEEADVETWSIAFARPAGNFSQFFEADGDRVAFLSSRDFLVTHDNSTHRGLWMARELFCDGVPPEPPNDVQPVVAAPGKTRRQTLEEIVGQDVCRGCHVAFDPLGYSLEHYDALGDYRTTENGLPIDASGTYEGYGAPMVFSNIGDLAPQLGGSCQVQHCFARKVFEYALFAAHGATVEYGDDELSYVAYEFRGRYGSLGHLLQAVATTPSFLRE
jgi:hypothetical protein